ncbi:MAG TPA: hypothetical protein VK789_00625, partial [Bryobacteraceae bacterium]|nr:hypothetical protein [Bryobacteraceae bacterium]
NYGAGTQIGLRAGAPILQVPVSSSQPAVAQPSVTSLSFAPGGNGSTTFGVNPGQPGSTIISISPPANFHTDALHEQVPVQVTLPSFTGNAVSVARDFEIQSGIQAQVPSLPTTIVVTVTSNDPSHVLLSTRPDLPGQAQISLPFSSNNSSSPSAGYYIQGIAEGQTTITVSGTGFADTTFNVTVTQPTFYLLAPFSPALVGQTTAAQIGFNGQLLRPGAQLSINLHSSDTTVATVDSPVVISAGVFPPNVNITPIAPGNVTISADLPPGYTGDPQHLSFNLTVSLPSLPFYGIASTFTVGKNLQALVNLTQNGTGTVSLTVTSSDPTKVLLSTDPKATGQASTSSPISSFSFVFYIQALADSGSATLTFSATGFKQQTATVNLAPGGFVFVNGGAATGVKAPLSFSMTAAALAPPGTFLGPESLRGGLAPVTLAITSSQPSVGTVTGPVVFNPGDGYIGGTFTPSGTGVTNLTISQPPGFTASTTGEVMVITVN